jgi:hypothetical protein
MTRKVKFVTAACAVFNCTPSVVLSALSGPVRKGTLHYQIRKAIRRQATRSTNYSLAEWKKAAKAMERHEDALFRLAFGKTK